MTSPDAPVTASASHRDARQAPYGPDPLGWLTTPLRRLYVDRHRRRHARRHWDTPEGSATPTIGASVDERPPDAPPTPSAPPTGAIGPPTPGMAHAPRQAPHRGRHTPPTATGYMGRSRTTGLRTPTNRRLRPPYPPSIEAHIQPPRTAPGLNAVAWRGVGAPCSRPLYGRPVPYRVHIQAVIRPGNVRGARRRPQAPMRPPVAPQGQLPKPEIERAEYQETPHLGCLTTNPKSQGCKGVQSPEGSDGTCHPADMDPAPRPGDHRPRHRRRRAVTQAPKFVSERGGRP